MNALYPTYEQWKEVIQNDFEETHEEVDCDSCSGTGESECHCCGNEIDCDDCNGKGFLFVDSEGSHASPPSFQLGLYRKDVLRALLLASRMTGRSYYKQARQFLDEFRSKYVEHR